MTAYQGNNATFYHGSMSTFDSTNLPGDPMGQGPFGQASNWPDDGCHPIDGTVSARYPMPYENGAFQPWVTGPLGQNFAEADNYASYNNVGYWGQIWPQNFATPNFQLADIRQPKTNRTKRPVPNRGVGLPTKSQHFSNSDVIIVAVMAFIVVCIVIYLASKGTFQR